jgi:hypothetical protein
VEVVRRKEVRSSLIVTVAEMWKSTMVPLVKLNVVITAEKKDPSPST